MICSSFVYDFPHIHHQFSPTQVMIGKPCSVFPRKGVFWDLDSRESAVIVSRQPGSTDHIRRRSRLQRSSFQSKPPAGFSDQHSISFQASFSC
jgi:hypothetical protein